MIIPEADPFEAMDAADARALVRARLAEMAYDEGVLDSELLEAFLLAASRDLARLLGAMELADPAELIRTARGLAVASVTIGANRLATAARDLERGAEHATPGRLARMYVTIEREVARVRHVATELLGNRAYAIAAGSPDAQR